MHYLVLVFNQIYQNNAHLKTYPIRYVGIVIETTGVKKYKIPVSSISQGKLDEAINQVRSGASTGSLNSNLDDLEKLANLKEEGVITEEEFKTKKKEILGL